MEANDNGLSYWVVFYAGSDDAAPEVERRGPFASLADAVQCSAEAYHYAIAHNIPWHPTETIFE